MLVRTMREAEIDEVAALRVSGWRAAYRGLIPQSYLDGMSAAGNAREFREMVAGSDGSVEHLVAEDDGVVVGWAALGPSRDADRQPDDGALYAIYVRPDRIGTGVGRALMERALERAAARPFGALVLWVFEGNTHARRFYESAGFTVDGATSTFEIDGEPVPEIRYRRTALP